MGVTRITSDPWLKFEQVANGWQSGMNTVLNFQVSPSLALPFPEGSYHGYLVPSFSQQQMVVKSFSTLKKSYTGGIHESKWIILKIC